MQEGSREVFQRLLVHSHANDFDHFLNYFEESERPLINALPKPEEPLQLHLEPADQVLHSFHYSWFIEHIEEFPKKFYRHILSIFSSEQKQKLQKIVQEKKTTATLSPLAHSYLVQWFLKKIGYNLLPPLCFLPVSSGNQLLNLDKKLIVKMLHHLGILEIANMAQKIVDKKVLHNIFELMTPSQKKWFKEAQKKYSEPLPSSTHDFEKKLQDESLFTNFLEKRGLLRLAKGLACEHRALIWHLAHHLDNGRGKEFLNAARKSIGNTHTPFYHRQVLEIAQSTQEKES